MSSISISIPDWVDQTVQGFAEPLVTDEERMRLCILLSRRNTELGGGPFGALAFARGQLVAAGVNLVLQSGCSIAHAEIVAMSRAQQLPTAPSEGVTLYASTEPCCQCFGALIWAGVERLVCAATTEDAQAIGFDEGPKPEAWAQLLEQRGINVLRTVERDAARSVLQQYQKAGGVIYGSTARRGVI